ncbi:MAG: hypothetical protein JRG97_02990 [Deltaproteobacteria bacterium]|nr:hypothetical protein [Deltaproteobacteria bacterium]
MKNWNGLILSLLTIFLVSCNSGTQSTSSVTPINLKDKETLQGTYAIHKVEISGSNGSQTTADDFDVFLGYMAIDIEHQRIIVDTLIVEGGTVILDLSDIRTGFYYDRLQVGGGSITFDGVSI